MNARGSFLTKYALFLFRRELSILSLFLMQGRRRRIFLAAYWRASFFPGLLGLYFVAMRLSGLGLGAQGPGASQTKGPGHGSITGLVATTIGRLHPKTK